MVELRLDAQEGSLSKDMYVAVRVGDVQKLSKVGASKSYKFPTTAAKGRRYGKIELFRRVGSSSISIDQENVANIQEVTIQDKENPFRFQVHLANGVDIEKRAEKKDDGNPKVAAAKAYLDKHHLELRLAEAMQSVLRERPDDPAAYVAAKLQSNAGMVQISPKASPSPKVEVVMLPFKAYYSKYVASLPAPAWDAMYAKFPAKVPVAQAPSPAPPPIVPCTVPVKPVPQSIAPPAGTPRQAVSSTSFGDYYRKHWKSCPAKAWDAMYTRFPSKVAGKAAPTSAPAPTAGSFSGYYRVNMAACPPQAWAAMYKKFPSKAKAAASASTPPKVPVSALASMPFGDYHKKHMKACPGKAWAAMYASFPSKVAWRAPGAPVAGSFTEYYRNHVTECPVQAWEAMHAAFPSKARAKAAVVPQQASGEGWQQWASVGTWCAPRLFRGVPADEEVQKPEQNFQQLASVGTWCAPRLFRGEASADDEASAANGSSIVPDIEVSRSNFIMRPSVGTWCAPLLEQAAGEALVVEFPASPSHLSPSVGTWLMHIPPSDEAVVSKKKPLHMLPMSTRYGAAFHSCGVRPGMCCF